MKCKIKDFETSHTALLHQNDRLMEELNDKNEKIARILEEKDSEIAKEHHE